MTIKRESIVVKGLSAEQIKAIVQMFRESGLELVESHPRELYADGRVVVIAGYYVASKRDKSDRDALHDRLRLEFPDTDWSDLN